MPVRTASSARVPAGAVRRAQPESLAPMLSTRVADAPAGDEWLHELKLDGYRLMAFLRRGRASLLTRNGHDWTPRFWPVARAMEAELKADAIIDGEVVVLNQEGKSDFHALQAALDGNGAPTMVFFAFDLPWHDGLDLRRVPLEERKRILEKVIGTGQCGRLRYSAHVVGSGPEAYTAACAAHIEGIMSKRRDSLYISGRSEQWLKVKCYNREEYVIGGYTPPQGSRQEFGSLIIGQHDREGNLRFRGRVGTGFDHEALRSIKKLLDRRRIDQSPFSDTIPREIASTATWVKPELVAEVKYNTVSPEGILRQPSFIGLREDKPAEQVRPEVMARRPEKGPSRGTKTTQRSHRRN